MTQEIRDKAKSLGIKSWHVKAIDKLQEEISAIENPVIETNVALVGALIVGEDVAEVKHTIPAARINPAQFGLSVIHDDGKIITVQDVQGATASVKATLSESKFLAAVRSVGVVV